MATVSKTQDRAIPSNHRAVSFDATTPDFAALDVIDFQGSLGRSASRVEIVCDADASVTVRINSQHTRYPIHPEARLLNFPAKDLASGTTYTNAQAATETVGNGETLVIDDLAISNLEVTALTVGAGTGVVINAR